MSMHVFRQALKLAGNYGEDVALGGGEPTLHPYFEKMLLLAIAAPKKDKAFIVTNGSIKERAMMLYQLASQNVIYAKLSYDQFHNLEMVDDEVIEAYKAASWLWGPPLGQDEPFMATRKLSNRGRARQFKEAVDYCACEDWIVKPDGKVYQCGCEDAPQIGDVWGRISGPGKMCCHFIEVEDNHELIP